MLDNKYRDWCKQIARGGYIDKGYNMKEELLCWKNRVYVLEGLWQRIMESEHDYKVAGQVGRKRTFELISRNFYRVNMERDIRKYCNEWEICPGRKAQDTPNTGCYVYWTQPVTHRRRSVPTLLQIHQSQKEQQ